MRRFEGLWPGKDITKQKTVITEQLITIFPSLIGLVGLCGEFIDREQTETAQGETY